MCEDHSQHTVYCERCMDPGTLLQIVDKLNALERVGRIQSVQRYMISVQKILNSGHKICGSYGAGKCSFVLLFLCFVLDFFHSGGQFGYFITMSFLFIIMFYFSEPFKPLEWLKHERTETTEADRSRLPTPSISGSSSGTPSLVFDFPSVSRTPSVSSAPSEASTSTAMAPVGQSHSSEEEIS